MAFADCADRLTLNSGPELRLTASGPRAGDCGDTADNLVIKAARLLSERVVDDLKAGRIHPRQATAGRGRHRRRLGGCRRGAAPAGARQRACARRRSAPDRSRTPDRRRRAGVPVVARLRHDRRRRNAAAAAICRRCRACWSIPRVPVATSDVFAALGLRNGQLLVGVTDVILSRVGRKPAPRSTHGSRPWPASATISKRRRCGSSR